MYGSEQAALSCNSKPLCIPKIQKRVCLSPLKYLPVFRKIIVSSSSGPAVALVQPLYHEDADILTHPNVSKNLPIAMASYISVSQPPGRGPVPDPGMNYTGPREVLLEFVIVVF